MNSVSILLRKTGSRVLQSRLCSTSEVIKKDLLIDLDEETGIQTITLNRPRKLNAINYNLYAGIPSVLAEAGDDPKVKITVFTASGRYFSSGNDLGDMASRWMKSESPKAAAEMSAQVLRNFVASIIEYPKVLVAAVNGPAVGISATMLGIFDAVYLSETATLRTPFVSTAQAPEGCASYTFPRIMGRVKANELLLFDKTMTASEAKDVGLANEVFPADTFEENVKTRLEEISQHHPMALERIKKIIRSHDTDMLHLVNERECQHLTEVWQSKECNQALQMLMAKLQSKS